MKKFEYKIYIDNPHWNTNIEKLLNKYGQDGWELVCIDKGIWGLNGYYFKREI
jgi:hypothetical protein